MDDKIKFVQTALHKSTIDNLKTKSGQTTAKDAIYEAINHYLQCNCIKETDASETGV